MALPSWQEIAETLRERVRAGDYPVGSLIPSTTGLAAEFGVTRGPARAAVEALKREGVLEGEPGRGVRVAAVPSARLRPVRDVLAEHEAQLREIRERLDRLENQG